MPYELPSWLSPAPERSPADYLLAGVNAGTGVAHNFLAQRELNMRQQEQDALLPIRQQLLSNQVKNTALDIQDGLNRQQDYLLNKQAFVELGATAKQISANAAWANPESEAAVWDIARRYPSVVSTPQFKNVIQQFDVAGAAAIRAKDADTRAAKAAQDADFKTQSLGLKDQEMKLKDAQFQDALAQKDRATAANNDARIQIQQLKNESAMHKLLAEAPDQFDSAAKRREYSEGVRAIFKRDDIGYEAKLQEAESLRKRLKEGLPTSQLEGLPEDVVSQARAFDEKISATQKDITALKTDFAKTPPAKYSVNATGKGSSLIEQFMDKRSKQLADAQDKLKNLQGAKAELLSKARPGAAAASVNEVRRVLQDGKVGIFDADTKKFIRYAD